MPWWRSGGRNSRAGTSGAGRVGGYATGCRVGEAVGTEGCSAGAGPAGTVSTAKRRLVHRRNVHIHTGCQTAFGTVGIRHRHNVLCWVYKALSVPLVSHAIRPRHPAPQPRFRSGEERMMVLNGTSLTLRKVSVSGLRGGAVGGAGSSTISLAESRSRGVAESRSAERRAPSAERRAPSAERRAPSAERRAPSAERRGHDRAPGAGAGRPATTA